MRRVVIGYLCVGIAFVLAFAGLFFLQGSGFVEFGDVPFTGFASDGQLFLCINSMPLLNVSNCSTTLNQSTSIIDNTASCFINATDTEGEDISFNVSGNESWYWINNVSGLLTIRPFQDQVGSQDIIVIATDTSNCSNSNGSATISLSVLDINDPPVLISAIPNVQFAQGSSLSPFSLYDFFDDPDNDVLNFSVLGNSVASVSITQGSGAVYFSASGCGTDYILFRATDPFNETAESGIVTVTVSCTSSSQEDSGSSGGSGGSGYSSSCTPQWKCHEWSDCFINGTRKKECIDLHGCSRIYERIFWEECTYIPTCFDGVRNQGELGIDCGGPCRSCGTCFDGVQNNDEEAIDCGGDSCEPCSNCTDGIMNWGEIGIDCGGEFCVPCASCFDGVQNQDETGIDCGGPCPQCVIGETPGVMSEKSPLTLFIMILSAILIIIIILFKFYHKKIIGILARFGLYVLHQKKKLILLNNKEKIFLLDELRKVKIIIKEMEKPASSCIDMLAVLARKYYYFALDVDEVFDKSDVIKMIPKMILNPLFRKILNSYFVLVEAYEQVKVEHSYGNALEILEELRLLVLLSSDVSPEDLSFEATEKQVTGSSLERAKALLFNIHLALQFEEGFAAKDHYLQLVSVYERLSESEKGLVYAPMIRSYHEIKYVLSLLNE